MTEPGAVSDTGKAGTTGKVIHATHVGGLAVAFLVFLYLGGTISGAQPAEVKQLLRIIGYALVVVGIVLPYIVRGRIPPPRQGADPGEWWAANLPKAVVVWALAEGGGLGAMVLGWVVGDATLLAVGAAAGLAVLFVNRPGRLASGL